jgi:hypothetical protein
MKRIVDSRVRFALLAFIASQGALRAQDMKPHCSVFVSPDPSIPGQFQSIFKKPGTAAMSCRAADDIAVLSELSPVTHDQSGVCRFTATRLAAQGADLGAGAQASNAVQFMMLAGSVCPDQRDRRYVPTYDITPKEFEATYRIWMRTSSSDAALLKTVSQLREKGRLWLDTAQLNSLRKAVDEDTLQLISVGSISKIDQPSLGPGYTLFMRDQLVHPNQYVVYVTLDSGADHVAGISSALR